jgi:hypothetical protein
VAVVQTALHLVTAVRPKIFLLLYRRDALGDGRSAPSATSTGL